MAYNDKLPVYEESGQGDETNRFPHRAGQLIEYRKKWKLSQAELGQLLDIGTRTINRYEAGAREIPHVVMIACCWYDEHRENIFKDLGRIPPDLPA